MDCSFSAIKRGIGNLEFGWTKPVTLVTCIPVVSLIVQKIQLNHHQQTGDFKLEKLHAINKWHALGSLVQTICLLALSILYPIFLLPAAISAFQLYLSFNGMKECTVPNKNVATEDKKESVNDLNWEIDTILQAYDKEEARLGDLLTKAPEVKHYWKLYALDKDLAFAFVEQLILAQRHLSYQDWELLFPERLESLCELLEFYKLNRIQLIGLANKAVEIAEKFDEKEREQLFEPFRRENSNKLFKQNLAELQKIFNQKSENELAVDFSDRTYMYHAEQTRSHFRSATSGEKNPMDDLYDEPIPANFYVFCRYVRPPQILII
jgi:hypothetical protein